MMILGRAFFAVLAGLSLCLKAQASEATPRQEYHVAKSGDDRNEGTAAKPFLTIMAAAERAQAGDMITVHEGIYREEISPPRGGVSDAKRIVYQAAPDEKVSIRGSEVVTGWTQESSGIWRVEVPNALFGAFNPFADVVSGNWFKDKGRDHHTGCVYIDGEWLFEAASKEDVPKAKWKKAWYAEVGEDTTTIWAVFDGMDPNRALTEVNVRQTVFYPRKPFVNYITVKGFDMRHAAPKWAPPTAEQMGLIGTHWSKGWIIEDCKITHSINTGLSLGKYADEFDNLAGTAAAYLASIDRARQNGWNKETVGSHIIRNNEISYCEQAGIVGSMGASFSRIIGNHIHHIHIQARYTGAEMAGIKFHAPIDMLIEGNRIHDAGRGLWLDWMTQGTRVTRNLLYRNGGDDFFLEVNHGPCVIDNNLFLSRIVRNRSQGMAFAHNLFGGELDAWLDIARATPYFPAHSTEKAGIHKIDVADNAFYNNVFVGNGSRGPTPPSARLVQNTHPKKGKRVIGYGLWICDGMPTPLAVAGNVYYRGAAPARNEAAPVVMQEDPGLAIVEKGREVYLRITVGREAAASPLVTSELLGYARVPNLMYLNHDGSRLTIDTDYFGKKRDPKRPTPGPFEKPGSGPVEIRVWPNDR
jgi:alpha-N-arabinofuranosidase